VDRAVEVKADIIALSTLMTTTMERMGEVIGILEEENIRSRFKAIVGGSPINTRSPTAFRPRPSFAALPAACSAIPTPAGRKTRKSLQQDSWRRRS
jgi:hypothetical protein